MVGRPEYGRKLWIEKYFQTNPMKNRSKIDSSHVYYHDQIYIHIYEQPFLVADDSLQRANSQNVFKHTIEVQFCINSLIKMLLQVMYVINVMGRKGQPLQMRGITAIKPKRKRAGQFTPYCFCRFRRSRIDQIKSNLYITANKRVF